jgi:hypothetical protein
MVYVYGSCDTNAVHGMSNPGDVFEQQHTNPKSVYSSCEIPEPFPAFALQLSMRLIKMWIIKEPLFGWIIVYGSE